MYNIKHMSLLIEYINKLSSNFTNVLLFLESDFFLDIFFEINFNYCLPVVEKIRYKEEIILYFKNYNFTQKKNIDISIFLETLHFFYLLKKVKTLHFMNLIIETNYYKKLYVSFYQQPDNFFFLSEQKFNDELNFNKVIEFIINYYALNKQIPDFITVSAHFTYINNIILNSILYYFNFKIKFYNLDLSLEEINDFMILRNFLINIQKLNYNFNIINQSTNLFLIDIFLFNNYINILQNIEYKSYDIIINCKAEKIKNINIKTFINSTPDFFNLLSFFYSEKILFSEDFFLFSKTQLFKDYIKNLDAQSQEEFAALFNILVNTEEFTIIDLINYIKKCKSFYFSSFKNSDIFNLILELISSLNIEFFEVNLKVTELIEVNITQRLLQWITLDNFLELTYEKLICYTNSIEFINLLYDNDLIYIKTNYSKFIDYNNYIINLLSFMYFVKFFYLIIEKKMSKKFFKLVENIKMNKFKE